MSRQTMGQSEDAQFAVEVCARFELSPEARALVPDKQTPAGFFNLLVEKKLYRDAVRFAAHLLPSRQAVWWACVCAWQMLRPQPNPKQTAALKATVAWVLEPVEARRRAAEVAGKAAGAATSAGAVALAAFYSDGSLSRADLPAVPPPPFLTAKTVAAAVLMAVALGKPDQAEFHYRQVLSMAIEVAQNWEQWKSIRKD